MEEKHSVLSDEVLVEIVHSIKEILIRLIDQAFPQGQRQVELKAESEIQHGTVQEKEE